MERDEKRFRIAKIATKSNDFPGPSKTSSTVFFTTGCPKMFVR